MAPMADLGTSSISRQANVASGDSQELSFRPGAVGRVSVHTDLSRPNARSETGNVAQIFLRRPGAQRPLASAILKRGTPSGGFSYAATAADLAAPGNWTCDIDNDSLEAITFTTAVTFPIDVPVATASFDIGLLNIILAKLVDAASVRLHIESSGDGSPRSFVSLSQDIADLLGLPSVTTFPVADQTDTVLHFDIIYRIVNLDSDPEYPTFYLQPDPLAIMLVLRFDTQSARLVAQNLPSPADVIVDSLDIEATIGFGSGVQIAVNAVAHVDFQNIDASEKLAGGIRDGINSQLQGNPAVAALLDKKALRSRIDSLFVQMMRLGKGAVIRGYSVNDGTLTVTYFVPPP
jgi:hypothetical protein